jgi:hypothetical protein
VFVVIIQYHDHDFGTCFPASGSLLLATLIVGGFATISKGRQLIIVFDLFASMCCRSRRKKSESRIACYLEWIARIGSTWIVSFFFGAAFLMFQAIQLWKLTNIFQNGEFSIEKQLGFGQMLVFFMIAQLFLEWAVAVSGKPFLYSLFTNI